MKKSGIYCIENLKNGKKYIGQSTDLERREREHFWTLKRNYHSNTHLQNSYNKYGEKVFKFRVLLYCKPFELTKYEQFFVDFYTPELLYNVRLECVDSNQGITFSKETRKKMSQNHADISGKNNPNYGKHLSKEAKRKMSEVHKKENLSEETIRKMSEVHKKENLSEETRKKMSEAQSGKHLSKETKEKISNALSGENSPVYGKHFSEETKEKMSKAQCGKHFSDETRKKMSVAQSGEKGNNSKLKEKQVFEILDLYYNKGKSQTNIAKKFPVNNVAISSIVKGKHWKSCYKKFMENNEK